jgi:hypothetical protein
MILYYICMESKSSHVCVLGGNKIILKFVVGVGLRERGTMGEEEGELK